MQKIDNKVDIAKYLVIIARKRYLFLCIFVLVTIIGIIHSYSVKKAYKASAIILIERSKIHNPLMRGSSSTSGQEINTVRQLITSRSRLLRVIRNLDLDLKITTPLELLNLIDSMRRAIAIRSIGKNLYRISYEGDEPEIVKDVVNSICTLFIEENLGSIRGGAHEAFSFTQTQLVIYRKKLEESETALRLFKEQNLGEMPGEKNINLKNAEKYSSLLAEAKSELKQLRLRKTLLQKQLSGEKPLIITSRNTTSLKAQLAQMNSKLEASLMRYTEEYPGIIILKNQIKKTEQRLSEGAEDKNEIYLSSDSDTGSTVEALNPIYQRLKEDLNSTIIKINLLKSQINDYKKKQELYFEKVLTIPKKEQELIRLKRDYNVTLGIYKTLLNKLEEARISRELEARETSDNFQIIDAAQVPLVPSKPNRPKLILIGIALGLLSAYGVIFLLNFLDTSIANTNEARDYFNYPVLAEIPAIICGKDIRRKKISNVIFFSLAGLFVASTLTVLIIESMNEPFLKEFISKLISLI